MDPTIVMSVCVIFYLVCRTLWIYHQSIMDDSYTYSEPEAIMIFIGCYCLPFIMLLWFILMALGAYIVDKYDDQRL